MLKYLSIAIAATAALAVGGFLLAGWPGAPKPPRAAVTPPPPEVGVVVTQAVETPLPVEYAGRVVGFRNVEVRPRVGGLLLTREYVEGAKVKEGDVLFRIDPATYEVALSRAEAATAGAGDAASGRGEFQTDRAALQQGDRDRTPARRCGGSA